MVDHPAKARRPMEQLTIKVPGAPVREVELAPGPHKVGRFSDADLQIDHPSVSGSHCEITVSNGAATIKDLGSTNGTLFDGQPVQECQILPGQTVRLGDVEVLFGSAATHYVRIPRPPRHRPKTFYKTIPGAFAYPFKRNGLLLLIAGTLVFGIFDIVLNLRVNGRLMVGLSIGGVFGAAIVGYLFLFMQSIINASAMGDDKIPNWPDFENIGESAFQPFLRLMAVCIAAVVPAIMWGMLTGTKGGFLIMPLLILGVCYTPMALLAVTMDDSLMGLNPLLVIPTIARVPLEYLTSLLLFGALFFLAGLLGAAANLWLPPVVRQLIAIFFILYFIVVEMRLLGLLYYCKKDRFGWRA
jgi:hypothetical protein